MALIAGVFIATPPSAWNPFSGEHRGFTGWLVAPMGLLFFLGLLLFGAGALLCTIVYPIARPRLIVSRWGVRSVWSAPGGEREIFSAPWTDVVAVGGRFTHTRWPMPYVLHITITTRTNGAQRSARRRRARRDGGNLVSDVDGMLRGRRRDVLAFLVHAHASTQDAARR